VQSLCRSGDIVYGTNDITVSLTRSRIAGCARLSRSGEVHFPQNHAFPTSCIRWRDSKTLSLIAAMVGAPILVPRLEMLTDQIPKLRTGLERMVRALGTLHAAYITEWNTTHGETEQLTGWDGGLEGSDNIRAAREKNLGVILKPRLAQRIQENCLAARELIFTKVSIEEVEQHATGTGTYSKVDSIITPSTHTTTPILSVMHPLAHLLTHPLMQPTILSSASSPTHALIHKLTHALSHIPTHACA
jgi:hypothetical protein